MFRSRNRKNMKFKKKLKKDFFHNVKVLKNKSIFLNKLKLIKNKFFIFTFVNLNIINF